MSLSHNQWFSGPQGPGYEKYMALPTSDRIGVARYYNDAVKSDIAGNPEMFVWLNYHANNFDLLMARYLNRYKETSKTKNEDGSPTWIFARQQMFDNAQHSLKQAESLYMWQPPSSGGSIHPGCEL